MSFKSPLRALPGYRMGREAAMGTANPIYYLLRDEFITARAAGSINGTAAEPGGTGGAALNTRNVTDTGNNLSINGGELVTTNRAGDGDPGLWYGAIARATGRVLLATYQRAGTWDYYVGFDGDHAGRMQEQSFRFSTAGALQARDGAGETNVATYAANTVYFIALALRAAGAYYLIKNGAFTNWTLLWVAENDATATLYPGYAIRATNFTMRSSWMRIPADTWLPTPAAYDTFTRANGALGSTETTGPDGQDATALAWTDSVGTWGVSGNTAVCSALDGGVGVATVGVGETDVLHHINLTRAGGVVGGVVRYVDADNYVYFGHDGTNAILTKRVGGVETNVISAAAAYGAGRRVTCIVDGTSFSLFYNAAKIGATSAIADAALQTGTRVGLYTTNTGNVMDNMLTMARGSDNEYAELETWNGSSGEAMMALLKWVLP